MTQASFRRGQRLFELRGSGVDQTVEEYEEEVVNIATEISPQADFVSRKMSLDEVLGELNAEEIEDLASRVDIATSQL
jgi:hypothetical protein